MREDDTCEGILITEYLVVYICMMRRKAMSNEENIDDDRDREGREMSIQGKLEERRTNEEKKSR